MRLTFVAGARPNFMKVAALWDRSSAYPSLSCRLVHTGQHYDAAMSQQFFDELDLPVPGAHLGVGGGSHAEQTARIMIAFDADLQAHPTDAVIVVGDVNSTLACALVAVKRRVKIAHVEAGLRSGDRAMPEEINRILTDQISDWLFATERTAVDNLLAEGIDARRIHFAGNVMIDTLQKHRARAVRRPITRRIGVTPQAFALATLHRPANVDSPAAARNALMALTAVANRLPTVAPLHPRTHARFREFGLWDELRAHPQLVLCEPLGYLDFLSLMTQSRFVFTDSGGIQEETTALGIPCLTFRDTTERPVTVNEGTNRLVGLDPRATAAAVDELLAGSNREYRIPERWDGNAADRILATLAAFEGSTVDGTGRPAQPDLTMALPRAVPV